MKAFKFYIMYVVYYTLETVNKSKPMLEPTYKDICIIVENEDLAKEKFEELKGMDTVKYLNHLDYVTETSFYTGGYAKIKDSTEAHHLD